MVSKKRGGKVSNKTNIFSIILLVFILLILGLVVDYFFGISSSPVFRSPGDANPLKIKDISGLPTDTISSTDYFSIFIRSVDGQSLYSFYAWPGQWKDVQNTVDSKAIMVTFPNGDPDIKEEENITFQSNDGPVTLLLPRLIERTNLYYSEEGIPYLDGNLTEPALGLVSQCEDGADNDGDGCVDLFDEDCNDKTDDSESGSSCSRCSEYGGTCRAARCVDGEYHERAYDASCIPGAAGDGGSDGGQQNSPAFSPSAYPCCMPTACNDGLDNDGDGCIDLLDEDCNDINDNDESGSSCTSCSKHGGECKDRCDSDENQTDYSCGGRSDNLQDVFFSPLFSEPPDPKPDCKDSDGGVNYYVKGTTSGYELPGHYMPITFTDTCNENILTEYKCGDDEVVLNVKFNCKNGCSNGACIPNEFVDCIDSDGGKNYFLKGTISGERSDGTDITDTDICYNHIPIIYNKKLREYYCTESGAVEDSVIKCSYKCRAGECVCAQDSHCPEGYHCENEKCVIEEEELECTDSDDGKDYYVANG